MRDHHRPRRLWTIAVLLGALVVRLAAQQTGTTALFARSPQYPLLSRDLETELAVNAAPKHVRAAATVLVLEPTGYVTAQRGTNAFTCLVSRRNGDIFPVCWDAEGTRSLLPVDLDDAQLRLQNKSGAEIEQAVAAKDLAGAYHGPARSGLAFMLSPLRYKIDEKGQAVRSAINPHVMFYGPDLPGASTGRAP